MKNILFRIFLIIIFTVISNAQNITNTLGTSGAFSIKDNINTFFTVNQADGTISLIAQSQASQSGSIFKGSNRFLHTYYGTGTSGQNLFLGINAGNFTISGSTSTEGSYNTGIGYAALNSLTNGNHNSAFGHLSLNQNTTGVYNSAFGSRSLNSNFTGSNNTASGSYSMYSNSTGNNNTASGTYSMYSNTYGFNNCAYGNLSMYSNSTGYGNTAYGSESMFFNTTGYENCAYGVYSMYFNNTGYRNSAVGYYTLFYNETGRFNSAFGYGSLYKNISGNYNHAAGWSSLYSNTNGSWNTAAGASALYYNTTGVYNTAVGYSSLSSNTEGTNNTAIGTLALSNITTGSNNTGIGYGAQVPSATSNNQVQIGNSSITYAGVQVAWTVTSDSRWKENIQTTNLGIDFISKLNPVSYIRKNDEKKRIELGLIAQQVDEVLKGFGINNSGILTIDDNGYYHLRYNDLFAPIIKAIQELKEENNSLKLLSEKQLTDLKSENDALRIENETFKERLANLEELQEKLLKEFSVIKMEKDKNNEITWNIAK